MCRMSRPCVVSEVLSVFIRETEPILLSTREREEISFSIGRTDCVTFDRLPQMSNGCQGPDAD